MSSNKASNIMQVYRKVYTMLCMKGQHKLADELNASFKEIKSKMTDLQTENNRLRAELKYLEKGGK